MSYDAVIVGARCAGAATALLLARQGARVLLLDRSRYGTDTLSTHALMRGAVTQLHQWGLLPGIVAAGTPQIRSATFHLPGAVTTVEVRSRARRRRACVTHRAPASSTIIYRYFDDDPAAGYHWHYAPGATGATGATGAAGTPGSAAGIIPTNDGLVCVFAATSAERPPRDLHGPPDTRFRRLLAVTAPELAGRRAVGPPRAFPSLTGYLRDAAGPGWALVGTPATSRTRSPRMASPTRCATRRSWPGPSPPAGLAPRVTTRPNVTSSRCACSA